MPRMKTPTGYYTLTETAQRLNISNSMVRRHVEKGRIRYLKIEGRAHGFYLKKDVDRLANQLSAFLEMEDEEETTRLSFSAASEEDLVGIARIGNALFAPGNKTTVPNWRYTFLKKNPETQYALKQDNKVIGFATILPFKPNSEAIEKLLQSDTITGANITVDEIEVFEWGKHIDLYLSGIGIDPDIDKQKRRWYGAALTGRLISTIVDLGRRGIIIHKVVAVGATHSGVRLLQTFGLHEIEPRVPGKRTFIMDIEESGSHVSMQYKDELRTSKSVRERDNTAKT